MRVERFAPSPSGYLHLGHGFSALMAARAADRFLVRIEDTDTQRCRPEYDAAIFEDLRWLGLTWEEPVWRQSTRTAVYQSALLRLADMGLIYPCRCTRKEIALAQTGTADGGPDGIPYPGTCLGTSFAGFAPDTALRIDMAKAVACLGASRLSYQEIGVGAGEHRVDPEFLIASCGDVVLWRKDTQSAAYHLAVVVDDAAQGITHVTRGLDVAPATPIHRLLQALLDLPTPVYNHHRLITDDTGKRLAKSFDSKALRKWRADGVSVGDLRRMLGI